MKKYVYESSGCINNYWTLNFETEIEDDVLETKNWRKIIEEAEEKEKTFEPVELEPGVWIY